MRRKLVRQGAATLMVSLPAKWARQHNLIKGSEVNMEPVNSNLIISPEAVDVKTETTIKLVNLTESSIRTLITNTYRRGYDRIKVYFENQKQLRVLHEIIKTRLIGFDVIKKEKDYCIVESITEPSEEQFDALIRKIFYNISEFFDITKKRMINAKETYDYEEVAERIQKYDNWCRRVISKKRMVNEKSEFLWTFLVLILHSQRELYGLNRILGKIKISKKTKDLLIDAERVFELIRKAYFEKNIHLLGKVHELEKHLLYTKGYNLLQETKGKENIIIYHIMVCIRELYQSNSPLSGLII